MTRLRFGNKTPDSTKEKGSYGDSGRLDSDDARQLIVDLVFTMDRRTHNLIRDDSSDICSKEEDESGQSPEKQKYGDSWTFLYGINYGMDLMKEEHKHEVDWDAGEKVDKGIAGDESWREHYDKYGYGVYGRGLEIGKRLAFYEDRDFTFSSGEGDCQSDSERDFTIKESFDDE